MSDSLRKLFDANKIHREDSGAVDVLVSLNAPPDDACLAALQELGLTVQTVAGDKLIGKIATENLSKLKELASVMEVERSEKLRPTKDREN